MINLKDITKAVEEILRQNLTGYKITRNQMRNVDANEAAKRKGWIGIYRGSMEYNPYSTGATPWLVDVTVDVEVQVATGRSEEECENKLQAAEQEILEVLNGNKNLNATVLMTNGYDIRYEINFDQEMYFQAAIISVRAQVRA